MPKFGGSIKLGLGGAQSTPTSNAMYPGTRAGGNGGAPPEVITGELLALVVVELMLLGAIRIGFKHNFGG